MTKSSLPRVWRTVKFGDVVDNMNETTRDPKSIGLDRVVGLDHMDPESLPLKRWDNFSDLHEGTSFTRVFRAGQVLFGKRRAYQRKVSLPDFDGICSGDILVFQPKNAELLPEFLPYLVQSDGFFDHALGTSAGSLSPRTKWQELAKYEFSLPPIAEQHRIVQLISLIDENTESLLDLPIENQLRSVLEDFLLCGSSKWDMATLGELTETTRPICYGVLKPGPFIEDGVPLVRITDMDSPVLGPQGMYRISRELDVEFRRSRLRGNEVLLSIQGTVGRVSRCAPELAGANISRTIAVIDCDQRMMNEFLVLLLERKESEGSFNSVGSTRASLNISEIRKIKVPLPPANEQQYIIQVAESLRVLDSRRRNSCHDLSRLRASILAGSFTGQSANV